ncbi:MAG: glycosyltransferase family 2 protein [Bacteroidetes bacterium]|jgi:glycosyltransferase involved in cell wall biosynthesis|nr:glycosyltransferase family 2 protein [Bacteroidota bacterium]
MIHGKKVVVVLPAYNAALTLEQTYREIPFDIVDEVVLVDDAGGDNTLAVGAELGIKHLIQHEKNLGYGGNQKTCYRKALDLGADIIIMLHPDYQYTPKLIPAMAHLVATDIYPVVIGSRILGKGAIEGGMPWIKFISNRILTMLQNLLVNQHLSEYHSGYRAFSREVLENTKWEKNSNDFLFDNQIMAQCIAAKFKIGEISCPTKYFPEASSISLKNSAIYGLGCLGVSLRYRLHRWGIWNYSLLK